MIDNIDNKIESLRTLLRRDKDHIVHALMCCLKNGVEVTVESVALYSYNTVSYVESQEKRWRGLLE